MTEKICKAITKCSEAFKNTSLVVSSAWGLNFRFLTFSESPVLILAMFLLLLLLLHLPLLRPPSPTYSDFCSQSFAPSSFLLSPVSVNVFPCCAHPPPFSILPYPSCLLMSFSSNACLVSPFSLPAYFVFSFPMLLTFILIITLVILPFLTFFIPFFWHWRWKV